MKLYILFVSLLITVAIDSKPLDLSRDSDASNEIDDDEPEKNDPIDRQNSKNLDMRSEPDEVEDKIPETSDKIEVNTGKTNSIADHDDNISPNLLASVLRRLQFAPETFFQDRLSRLKDNLENLGLVLPRTTAATSKNLSSILNLIGLNDSTSYANKLEPAGLFGGNGWFANKGGILGGPGAIFSTGSLLTDYPTAYRK